MIDNVNDINRVLFALEALQATRSRAPRRIVLRYLNAEAIYGQNPAFDPILEFAKHVELVSETAKGFGLTELGREMLSQNTVRTYELSQSQRLLMLRKCYIDGPFRADAKVMIRKFVVNRTTGRLTWSAIDSEPLGDLQWIGNHLVQLGVFEQAKHLLVATAEYNDFLLSFRDQSGDFTEAQFRESLKEKKLLGNIAEKFVVGWERKRLKAQGYSLEATCVNWISKQRVNAGYDVESFDGPSKLLAHDRFIEVKGSGKASVRFVWTPTEMEKAAELGRKYWVYFVGGIQRKTRTVTREPLMLQDPHSTLNAAAGFSIQPKGDVLVTSTKAARALATPELVAK